MHDNDIMAISLYLQTYACYRVYHLQPYPYPPSGLLVPGRTIFGRYGCHCGGVFLTCGLLPSSGRRLQNLTPLLPSRPKEEVMSIAAKMSPNSLISNVTELVGTRTGLVLAHSRSTIQNDSQRTKIFAMEIIHRMKTSIFVFIIENWSKLAPGESPQTEELEACR